jgi:hypothetical protein
MRFVGIPNTRLTPAPPPGHTPPPLFGRVPSPGHAVRTKEPMRLHVTLEAIGFQKSGYAYGR